jgi:hypothetical protein
MSRFRCVPIPTETAARWRTTGRDDRGNALIKRIVDGPGFPCRHCLRLGAAGEEMLLGSYDLPRPQGVYWTPSPIFLHAEDCPRFTTEDTIAPIVLAPGIVSVRSYDAEQMCLYDRRAHHHRAGHRLAHHRAGRVPRQQSSRVSQATQTCLQRPA